MAGFSYSISECLSPHMVNGDIVAQYAYLREPKVSYENRDLIWRAFVTKRDSKYVLWFQTGEFANTAIEGGEFTDGAVVAQHIRTGAVTKFGKAKPTIDTLSVLEKRTPDSVVPECYAYPSPISDKCPSCPFEEACTAMVTGNVKETKEVEEHEDLFLKRLHGKVKEKWGG